MKLLFIIIFLVCSFSSYATEQISEEFVVDGARFEIEELPLSSLISSEDFNNKFKKPLCTANWRGYKGSWALRNNKLVLTYLVLGACSKNPPRIEAKELFDKDQYPVEASWFTGKINVRIGERKWFESNAMERSSVIFEAVVYEFQSGELVSRKIEMVEQAW